MRLISFFYDSGAQGGSGKMNNLPKHHCAGPNASASVASA